ncbi:FAD-binding oxidoreductase [Streptomyces sp. NPDC056716]|uniref:FAD-binding oxidoreductase n=1 Tax=unclassified Streptomyces TaxID=2593676 RepID=UPI003693F7AE
MKKENAEKTVPEARALRELKEALPDGRVITDPSVIEGYRRDEAEWAQAGNPLAVVRPRTTAEVASVVRCCLAHGIAIVPRGGGSGVSGGATASDGAIVLSLDAMDTIVEIDAAERLAVVQPGVVNGDLRDACAAQGLWYPPDPSSASWSTIGGNVATNAGGICCAKYGVTRDYVLGMEIVNGLGEVVRLGRRTAKGVAGFDLCGLMVGSEGTLGVITEVTLRLRGARAPERTVVGFFDSAVAAGEAVSAVIAAGVVPSALELLDHASLKALDAVGGTDLAGEADTVLLGRTDASGAAGEAESHAMLECFRNAGAGWADRSADEAEAEALFQARREIYPAVDRIGAVLSEDVCVPRGAVPAMLAAVTRTAAEHDLMIATVAHAADGNLHPLIVVPRGDDAAGARAQDAVEAIIGTALALGGTVTGEHGVGLLKKDGLAAELGPASLAMHHAVKAALDPAGIFNPGKVLDTVPRRG